MRTKTVLDLTFPNLQPLLGLATLDGDCEFQDSSISFLTQIGGWLNSSSSLVTMRCPLDTSQPMQLCLDEGDDLVAKRMNCARALLRVG